MDLSLGAIEHHVGDYGDSNGAALSVLQVDLAYRDGGTDSYETGAGEEAAFGYRAEVVYLHFDGGETAGAFEVLV